MFKKLAPLISSSARQLRFQRFFRQGSILNGFAANLETAKHAAPQTPAIRADKLQHRHYSSSSVVRPASYEEVKDVPNHPEILLIDVREAEELKETGQIPSSIHIPIGVVKNELGSACSAKDFKTKYGREKPEANTEIIFYCLKGIRAGKAADSAITLGYKNVKNYVGSWTEWAQREGLNK